ncbi:MAG: hypothetical protein ABUS51_05430 [Acidobacteriota bacterium]
MRPATSLSFRLALGVTLLSTCGLGQATCVNCAVPGIDPKASTPFAKADTSHGCTTGTKLGFPVPDPQCTPGAINPTITVEVLRNKDFRTGCIRDCATTETDKRATYGFYSIAPPANNQGSTQTCELDHLVSLELGGADTLDNIWPQCGPNQVVLAKRYFKQKDLVENFLAVRVRTGKLALADVQKGIAADWTQYLGAATTFCNNNPITCSQKR